VCIAVIFPCILFRLVMVPDPYFFINVHHILYLCHGGFIRIVSHAKNPNLGARLTIDRDLRDQRRCSCWCHCGVHGSSQCVLSTQLRRNAFVPASVLGHEQHCAFSMARILTKKSALHRSSRNLEQPWLRCEDVCVLTNILNGRPLRQGTCGLSFILAEHLYESD